MKWKSFLQFLELATYFHSIHQFYFTFKTEHPNIYLRFSCFVFDNSLLYQNFVYPLSPEILLYMLSWLHPYLCSVHCLCLCN